MEHWTCNPLVIHSDPAKYYWWPLLPLRLIEITVQDRGTFCHTNLELFARKKVGVNKIDGKCCTGGESCFICKVRCSLNRVKEGSINIVYDSTRNSVNTNMPGSSVLSKETNRSSEIILQEIFNATKSQTLHLLTALFLL